MGNVYFVLLFEAVVSAISSLHSYRSGCDSFNVIVFLLSSGCQCLMSLSCGIMGWSFAMISI